MHGYGIACQVYDLFMFRDVKFHGMGAVFQISFRRVVFLNLIMAVGQHIVSRGCKPGRVCRKGQNRLAVGIGFPVDQHWVAV